MRSVPVVLVYPRFEVLVSFFRVLVELGIGPLADGCLYEAFGLAVGAWRIDAGADVFQFQAAVGVTEQVGDEAGSVVGHHTSQVDVVPREVGMGLAQEA